MLKYLLCALPFIPISLPCANTSSVDEAVYKPIHEVCDQYGISPVCDDELEERKNPSTEKLRPFTNSQAAELIKLGGITAQDLYEIDAITLKQKQQLELESIPARL